MKSLICLLLLVGCFIQGSQQDSCLVPLNFKNVLHRLNRLKHDPQLKESALDRFGSNLKLNEFVAKSFANLSVNKSIIHANLSNDCLNQFDYWLNALAQKQNWALRSINHESK